MIQWPRPIHRSSREACSVARACAVEAFPVRRRSARWLLTAAALGLVVVVAVQFTRTGG